MDSEDLLAQLADIHLPEPVSFWPPAIGWWILAALALVLLIILFRKFASYRRSANLLIRLENQDLFAGLCKQC